MGVGIDETDEGEISLSTQIYRPSQGVSSLGGKAAETAYINVVTQDNTVTRAIRDIPINLGRKAQWSHIRLIIIGEKLARERSINETLEFFYRDHEPRLTTTIMIAKGKASQYLRIEPFIENTTSQQIFQSGESADESSGKTINANLLKLGLQLKSQVGNAIIPYVYFSKDPPTVTNVAGAAMIKKGKYVGRMAPNKVESLKLLFGEYPSGMLDIIPCPGVKKDKESEVVEMTNLSGKLQPIFLPDDSLKVRISLKAEIALIELSCSKIMTLEDEKKFTGKVEETIKERVEETIDWLKQKKFDALGLGNKVYQKNPRLWKKWKPDWDNRFARTPFEIDVEVKVINSGTVIPKPAINE